MPIRQILLPEGPTFRARQLQYLETMANDPNVDLGMFMAAAGRSPPTDRPSPTGTRRVVPAAAATRVRSTVHRTVPVHSIVH